jgi:nicotinate phosphoribosyltransferase
MTIDLRLNPDEVPLLLDLYELTMAAAYFKQGRNDSACFSLWVRRLPKRRGFLVAAGLERVLEVLEQFHFSQPALDYLDSLHMFGSDFLSWLAGLRFSGEVWALPEGTIFFGQEPLLELRAPLIEAQLVETLALNQIGLATLIASKAARVTAVAGGRRLVEFGLRRTQGADAGLVAARSSYLAGFAGTSNVLAGLRYGLPLYGTMAHSFVMVHDHEREAFARYAEAFPNQTTLLVDTYDVAKGVDNAARVALELGRRSIKVNGIRLDSGDLAALSRAARATLDRRGLKAVSILASGNLDEYRVRDLAEAKAPIDAFGVGTAIGVSADAPALDVAYKLVEYGGQARLKTSEGKMSLPGRKQVFRACDSEGRPVSDLIGLFNERADQLRGEFRPEPAVVRPLLEEQMRAGRRLRPAPDLAALRARFLAELEKLDRRYQDLDRPASYPVRCSAALEALLKRERESLDRRQD